MVMTPVVRVTDGDHDLCVRGNREGCYEEKQE